MSMPATRIVLSKSGVRHLHGSCTQQEKCRRIYLGFIDVATNLWKTDMVVSCYFPI